MGLRHLIILFLCSLSLASCAQSDSATGNIKPVIETITVPLGDGQLVLKKWTFGEPQSYLFLQLHDNEATAEEAVIGFLQQHGGVLLSVENGGNRNVSFHFQKDSFVFDPNRIFTTEGRTATLQRLGKSSPEADSAVAKLAQAILQQLPDTALIIAVHNNTDASFSTTSYQRDSTYQKDAAAVHVNTAHDADNFFLTTEKAIYHKLVQLNYNVILQDNVNATNDGSLSVYFGKKGIRYVNVEAQHGHRSFQLQMIQDLLQALR